MRKFLRVVFIVLLFAFPARVFAGITFGGSLSAFNTTYGTASASQSFTVAGSPGFYSNLVVAAPNGFEVSLDDSNFSSSVSITAVFVSFLTYEVPAKTVYIRLKATAGAGSYSGNIVATEYLIVFGFPVPIESASWATPSSTVNPYPITITANNANKTYGQTLTTTPGSTAYTITSGTLQNAESMGSVTIAYGSGAAATDAVGSYPNTVTPSAATGGTFNPSNYTITYAKGNLTVDKAAITIKANNVNKTYGTALTGGSGSAAFTVTSGTLPNSETIGSVTIAYGSGAAATAAAGSYPNTITPGAAIGTAFDAANYTITYATGDLTVDKEAITVTAYPQTKVYGDSDPALTYHITAGALQNTDAFTGSLTRAAGENVGTYAINQNDLALNANYDLTYVQNNLTITQAAITITANDVHKTYGTALAGGSGSTAYSITSGSLKNSDAIDGITIAYGTGAAATAAAGSYPNTITPGAASGTAFDAANYTITYATGDLTVDKEAITVTAYPQTKVYGDSDPALTYHVTAGALQNTDAFTGSLTRTAGENVGTYAINQNDLALNANYDLTYAPADLTITKAAITITANDVHKTYGTALTGTTGSTAYSITSGSLKNSDAIDGITIAYGTGAAATDAAGSYPNTITPGAAIGTAFDAANYTITYATGDLTVDKEAITVTAYPQTKVYGDSDPALTYHITAGALQNTDAFTGSLTRAAGENVGTYAINQNDLALNANYDLTYAPADLTITKAAITITANDIHKTYGTALTGTTGSTAYSITSGSLKNSDAIDGITIAYGTGAAATDAAGSYPNTITPSAAIGTAFDAANYTITYATGDLTVDKEAITVTAYPQTKVYGDSDPALTYHITAGALQNTDAFTGSLTRAAGENVGTYAINQNDLALNANYDLTYVQNNLTITQAAITITANDVHKTYGTALAGGSGSTAYSITSGSLKNSDAIDGITIAYGTGAAATAAAGSYPNTITPGAASGTAFDAANYTITYATGDLTVDKEAITVTAYPQTKVYGDSDPALTYHITAGALQNTDAFTGSLTRTAGENVGTYAINQNDLALNANYDLTYAPADLTITKAAITITANDVHKTYGTALTGTTGSTAYSITSGSLKNSDAIDGITIAYGTGAAATDAAGSYPNTITPGAAIGTAFDAANYTITYATGDLTVDKEAITVTAYPQTKVYGDSDPALTYHITAGALQNTDAFTGSLTRAAGENVGTYAINQNDLALNANYDLTYAPADLTITKAAITITANDIHKTYGTALTGTTGSTAYSITSGSLKNSDAIDGITIAYGTGAAATDAAGSYPNTITPSAAIGTAFDAANYTITYATGDLTVDKEAITVTAYPQTKVYGDSDPALTYHITAGALQNTDAFTGSLTRTAGENVGTYAINQNDLALNANYDLTYAPADLTITKAAITITANDVHKTYGTALTGTTGSTAYSITSGSLKNSDSIGSITITYGTGAAATDAAGSYANTIVPGAAAGGTFTAGNYTITYANGDLTVDKEAITVTAYVQTKVYGDADPALTYHITSGALHNGDNFTGALNRAAGEDIGTYIINQNNLALSSNYDLTYAPAGLTITKRAITVTADAKAKIYGDADPALTYQITSGTLHGGDTFTGALDRAPGENIGTYDINQHTLTLSANYQLTYATASFEITPRAITVTADAKSKVYGDSDPGLTYQITSGALQGGDTFSGSLSRGTGENIGTYAIGQNNLALSSNYTLSYNPADLTITPRPITVAADAKTKTYGDTDPALTYQITSGTLHTGDTFSGNLDRVAGESVGTYAINQHNLSLSSNYALTYNAANLNITPQAITVTADTKTKTYGDTDPALTYQITSGSLHNGDTFTGALERTTGENVGAYTINQNTLGLSSNYTLNYISANLNITKQAITVTADAKTKTYGSADPALTYQVTSGALHNGDTFTGALSRTAGENVGTYAIGQNDLALSNNYDLTYAPANLTISQQALTITADAGTKVYGDADPALTYQITSGALHNGDGITGALKRSAGENIGTYNISQNTLAVSLNYALTFVPANLTITTRAITVTADAKTKVYDDADPALTYQITSGTLHSGDSFTGSLERTAGENIGTYSVNQGTLALNSNYALSYTPANLNITPRAITVTADTKAKVYGDTDPALSYQITSGTLHTGDTFSGNLARVTGENVGSYAINQNNLTLSSNYTLSYVAANLIINQQAITVTADAKTKVYGDTDPALTYQITSGSLHNGDTFSGSLSRGAGENVGTYVIGQNTLALSPNYALTYAVANLAITPRAITVTADAKSKIYGNTDPALTYQITTGALHSGDAFTGALSRTTGENVGAYTINQGSLLLSTNYTLTYVDANLNISARAITVTADAKSKIYGNTDPALTYQITSGTLQTGDTFSGSLSRSGGENIGTYVINRNSLALSTNYTLSYTPANLEITPRAITVTADVKSKVYGDSDPALTYQITSGTLQTGDTFSGSLNRAAGENVGAYAINQGSLLLSTNYALTYATANLNITPRAIAVTADAKSKVYGDTDPTLTYHITSGTLHTGDTFSGGLNRAAGENVGTYIIGQNSLALSTNYTLSYSPANLDIAPQAITVTADAKSKVYGDTDPALTYQITSGSLHNGDTFSGNLQRVIGENVGNYAINQHTLTLSGNYILSYIRANLGITPQAITIAADAKSKVYGNSDPALTYRITSGGLHNGDTFTGNLSRAAGESVGTYVINQSSLALSTNYSLSYDPANLNISPQAITVTADVKSKIYGEADPGLTYQITSGTLHNGDGFTGNLSRVAGENAGTYAIKRNTLALSTNYALTYVQNNLNITPASLIVTADNATKAYGAALPALSASYSGFVNGDSAASLSAAPILTTTANQASPVNSYLIAVNGAADPNYNITYHQGTLTVTPAVLNVTATGINKVYDGTTNATVRLNDDRVSGDNLDVTYTTASFDNKNAGDDKSVSVKGITVNGPAIANYTFNSSATTTAGVTKAEVIVTAQPFTKVYDKTSASSVNPVVTGLMSGDIIATAPVQSYSNVNAGTGKTIVPSGLIINDGNGGNDYNITYINNTAGVITPKDIAITAQADSKVYDGTNKSAVVPVMGALTNGDVIVTPPMQVYADANVGTNKVLVPSGAVINDGNNGNNYAINYINNSSGVITPARLTYTANKATKVYGDVSPAFSGTITGFVNGDTQASATSGRMTFTTLANTGSSVGNYAINGTGLIASNYVFTQASTNSSALSITPAILTIRANNQTKVYGSANPPLTLNYSGLVNGDIGAVLNIQPTVSTTANTNSPVNTYPITVSGASSTNYTINYLPGTLTVTPAVLLVSVNNEQRIYGKPNPAFKVNYSGFVNGDDQRVLTRPVVVATAANNGSLPGSYPLALSGGTSHNYTISYTDGLLMVMPLSNASLDNLSASAGPFTPPFDQTISNYVIDVPYSVDHTTVTPVMGDRTATIKVNDKQVSNGAASQSIQLSVGANVVEIVVIAQDDVTKRTYTITINRAPAPVINASGILPPQSTVYGNASSIASFTVSGLNMIGGILVTAPKGYELSLDKDSFSKTLTIGSAGVIEPTLVYERLASTAVVGTYQGDIKLSAAEANNATMPTGEGTVTPAHLQIIADNKTKGTGMANPPLTVTYSGFVNNDGPASLVTAPTITTTVNSMSAPGTYPIIASAASSPNYQITYGDGMLTVASLNIPNSFTPNSDGINDTWKIKNIEDYQNFTVEIYNRYGARVYYSVNYPSPWDGRMKGSDTPAGTYYYIIRLGGENRPLSGYLTVIR